MKIAIASDHGAFELKEKLMSELSKLYHIVDCGNEIYDPNDDYPIFAFRLAKCIANKEADFGIALCTSGIGISIACNKVKGAYCAFVHNEEEIIHTRLDNNPNIMAFSSHTSLDVALAYVKLFVTTEFSLEERHIRRNNMIIKYENGEYNEL